MEKALKIISICIMSFFISLFIHPKKVIYEPKISGKVVDQNENPIQNAIVARIEENEIKNNEFGHYEYEEFKSQIVKTDINGNFVLNEKSKIDWLHTPIDLPFVWCYANFEISKDGFITYRTEFDDHCEFNENLNACKGIVFNPKIILKRLKLTQ